MIRVGEFAFSWQYCIVLALAQPLCVRKSTFG